MMWAPTIATIVTLLLFDRRAGWWRRVGLGVPGGRWLRFLGVMALALVVLLFRKRESLDADLWAELKG